MLSSPHPILPISTICPRRESDVGQNRAEVTCPRLSELNPHVPVKANVEALTPEFIKTFSVVVLTNSSTEEQLMVDETCRENGAAFILAETRGLFGLVMSCPLIAFDGEEKLAVFG